MDTDEAIAICNALASEPRTNSRDSNAICRVLAENAKLRESNSQLEKTCAARLEYMQRMAKAGNAMAEYLAPGPIPTEEPTERDFILADWNTAVGND